MPVDLGEIQKEHRKDDPQHYNGFDLMPQFATILNAKVKNELIVKMAGDDTNKKMINCI
jgi:hypothetical protein